MHYPHPDQLVVVWSKIHGDRNGVSAGDFLDWKSQSTSFQSICAWTGGSYSLPTSEHPELIQTRVVTPGFNDMVGTAVLLGGDFLPEDGRLGGQRAVVRTAPLWED